MREEVNCLLLFVLEFNKMSLFCHYIIKESLDKIKGNKIKAWGEI